MNVPTKLAAFGALSAAVFFAALGVGAAVGPVDTQNQPTTHTPSIDGAHDTAGGDEMVAMEADSWKHHGPFRSAFEYDRSRRNALVANGWAVLQFTSRMSDKEIADRAEETLALQREILAARRRPA